MKQNIKNVLQEVDKTLNEIQPKTMDELLNVVHSVPGMGNYGTHYSIVKYKGYLQGIRVYVTGSKISHPLPSKDKVYSVFQGVDKYEAAGWKVEHEQD